MVSRKFDSLLEPLVEGARQDPDRLALIFVAEDGSKEEISAAQLHRDAAGHGEALLAHGIGAGDIIVLVLRHSRALLSAFWGAVYLGAVPSIFSYLTEKLDPVTYKERLRTLVVNCEARAVVTFPQFRDELATLLANVGCQVLSSAQIPAVNSSAEIRPPERYPAAEEMAVLQHTSGTTGLQKGVALSHKAILNQIRGLSHVLEMQPEDVIVSWVPFYHDMGLFGGLIMPIVERVTSVLLSPFHWVRSPKILFEAVHEYKGAMSWMPNFAFNHSALSIRERDLEGLDLSSWRILVDSAEPVLHESLQMFARRFAPYAFRETALMAAYGLAENSLATTMTPLGQVPHTDWVNSQVLQRTQRAVPVSPEASGAIPVVSCGFPLPATKVVIVDDHSHPLPDRHVGEIIVRGNCMFDGYYRRPDLTAKVLRDGWIHTGDVGYMVEGQLYVCERKKDIIIVGGHNIYPHDVEAIANRVPGIYPGRVVAFGVRDERLGTERAVLVCELRRGTDAEHKRGIERELRRRVVRELDVTLGDVRLLEHRWIIKSSSGKIARAANRQKYLADFA